MIRPDVIFLAKEMSDDKISIIVADNKMYDQVRNTLVFDSYKGDVVKTVLSVIPSNYQFGGTVA